MDPEPGDAYDAVIPLSDNQFENLLRAKQAMYGDEAEDVSNAHVISLLALQEINRVEAEEVSEEILSRGMNETAFSEEAE